MKKYPLGFALVYWKSGGRSEAVIFEDSVGNQCLQCSNWILTPNFIPYLSSFIDDIDLIMTHKEDLADEIRDD